jgi:hypothetical protein
VIALSAGDTAYLALAVFLVAVGLAGAWALLRLANTFDRLSSLIGGAERDLLPVAAKLGGTVERVNAHLDKLDPATDSAVGAVVAADQAVRSVSFAVSRPVQKITGVSAGLSHGLAALRARKGWKQSVAEGREAAARRERDFAEELTKPHG